MGEGLPKSENQAEGSAQETAPKTDLEVFASIKQILVNRGPMFQEREKVFRDETRVLVEQTISQEGLDDATREKMLKQLDVYMENISGAPMTGKQVVDMFEELSSED